MSLVSRLIYGGAINAKAQWRGLTGETNLPIRISFPDGSVCKESAYNTGDLGSIPGLGRPPAEGNGNPLQYSCLGNPTDREAWWATVHGVTKSQTQLSD